MCKIIPIILSGGVGSRLWPVSRSQRPKPFMWLEEEGSLLERTFDRLRTLSPKCIISVTNKEYQYATSHIANNSNFKHHMILEPFGRNTAGAVSIAAKYVAEHFGSDAIMVVLPSDHIIKDVNIFTQTIKSAIEIAQNDKLVTLGITPTKPHTGYGYIQSGNPINGGFDVQKFVEKPDLTTAQSYLDAGGYFWNAGMFVFTAGNYQNAILKHAPKIAEITQTINTSDNDILIDENKFANMPDISIDYAVMEHANNVAVVPALFDWNDLGAWDSVSETLPTDKNGNSVKGQTYMFDTKNTTVFSTSDEKVVTTVGIDNMTIVETRDAVLIADNNKLQDVKDVVNHLNNLNHDVTRVHRTEYRPWGTFTILDEGEDYKTKQILVYPHQKLSLQSHKYRSEHWIVVSGQATVINGDEVITLNTNQSTYIPQGNKHRLANNTDEPVIIIEVQTGTYFGEDDIVRYDDTYERS